MIFLISCLIFLKAICAILLVLPIPSNSIRGAILHVLNVVTDKFPQIKWGCIALALIEAVYLWFAVSAVMEFDPNFRRKCIDRIDVFRQERNCYMMGFGLFLTCVILR